jgi:hypothetical protein
LLFELVAWTGGSWVVAVGRKRHLLLRFERCRALGERTRDGSPNTGASAKPPMRSGFPAVPRDMVAVRIEGDVRCLAVAAPAYVASRGAPTAPDDLHRHRCIRQRLPSGKRYRWELKSTAKS